jgi:Endonuclease-reverse transcriptase
MWLSRNYGQIIIFSIYNDCHNSDATEALGRISKKLISGVDSMRQHLIWGRDFNRHHPMWDKKCNMHLGLWKRQKDYFSQPPGPN